MEEIERIEIDPYHDKPKNNGYYYNIIFSIIVFYLIFVPIFINVRSDYIIVRNSGSNNVINI